MIRFNVSGTPVPKQSYRHSKHGHWQPARVTAWAEEIGWAARAAYQGDPLTEDVMVSIAFYMPTLRRVDLDNLSKNVLDGMNGIIYEDDNQVVDLHLIKILDRDNPGVVVVVSPMIDTSEEL